MISDYFILAAAFSRQCMPLNPAINRAPSTVKQRNESNLFANNLATIAITALCSGCELFAAEVLSIPANTPFANNSTGQNVRGALRSVIARTTLWVPTVVVYAQLSDNTSPVPFRDTTVDIGDGKRKWKKKTWVRAFQTAV